MNVDAACLQTDFAKPVCAKTAESVDVPIFDVKGKVDGGTVDDLFLDFVRPGPTDERRVCELHQPDGTKVERVLPEKLRKLPSEILYNNKGLALFEKITELEDEYYLTGCEREILRSTGLELVHGIHDGASIIELGCGSLSKTATFLDHVRRAGRRDVSFYAVDIEKTFLQSSLRELVEDEAKRGVAPENQLRYAGIFGSYTDILASFLKNVTGQRVLVWLGSSIGNFNRRDATTLVRRFAHEGLQAGDLFFIGIDQRNDPRTVACAYNDAGGVTREFGLNGLAHLNTLIGTEAFDRSKFEYFAGYNETEGRHEAYYQSLEAQRVWVPGCAPDGGVVLEKDELIRYEYSYKYSMSEIQDLAKQAGLVVEKVWTDANDMYRFCMFRKVAANEGRR